jgi:hypothetical protein
MGIRSMIVWALALVALPQVVAAQQPDARLKPSLAPFVRERHPMRDPRRIKPYGEVTGSVPSGHYIGGSWTVTFWVKNMNAQLQPLGERLRALDSDLQLYDVDVNVTGGELVKKADATTKAKLDALNGTSNLGIMKTLQAYRLVKSKQAIAAKTEGAALQEVWAAIAQVDADAAVVRKQELVDEKASLETRQKAIMDKVKAAAWVKNAYETAKNVISTVTNPDKLKDYLATKAAETIDEALMNNVLLQYAQELSDIENRLTQVDAGIKSAGDESIQKRLTASEARLRAARLNLVKAGIQRTIASVEGWDYIDALAAEERAHKGTDVFETLQQYNMEVRTLAKAMRAHGADYLSMLNGAAPGEAPQVLKKVEADVAYVWQYNQKTTNDPQGVGGEFYPWLQQADVTRVYTQFQSEWYKAERDKVERYMTAIVSENHLDLVETTVRQLLKTMGSTTDI